MKKVEEFKEAIKTNNTELTLVRDSSEQFFRIWRNKFNGENANYETYGKQEDYKHNIVTPEYYATVIQKIQGDKNYRFSPKNDKEKTNITDAPGFGSVRNSPPYEDQNFDREYFEFFESIVEDSDDIVDYGGGMSPFLAFLPRGKKKLVDKNNIVDCVKQYGIEYEDADEWLKKEKDFSNTILFCFHTLEHTDNPEELIELFSKAGMFIFATPNEELIDTSIYHHIYMQMEIFKKIFAKNNSIAFLRLSKNWPLDIHGIVINSTKKWQFIKDNNFFKKYFKLYTEI